MTETVKITITSAGVDAGPFDIYSDLDGYAVPFETDVPKSSFLGEGYSTSLTPGGSSIVKLTSKGTCTDSIFVNINSETEGEISYIGVIPANVVQTATEDSNVSYLVDLGTATGICKVEYDISSGPVSIEVLSKGNIVFYKNYSDNIAAGESFFRKLTSSPSTVAVKVRAAAGVNFTSWNILITDPKNYREMLVSSPAGASAPCSVTTGTIKYTGIDYNVQTGTVLYNDTALTVRTYTENAYNPGSFAMVQDRYLNKKYGVEFDDNGAILTSTLCV
jgi:hypothetical protein